MLHSTTSNAFVASVATSSSCVAATTIALESCDNNETTGYIMPHSVGLGTYMLPREKVNMTLRYAILNAGYRRIDCAPVYFNEDVIGDTLHDILYPSDNGNHPSAEPEEIPHGSTLIASSPKRILRSDLYLVSKLPSPGHRQVELALRKTLNDLRVDYLDLYLGTLDSLQKLYQCAQL